MKDEIQAGIMTALQGQKFDAVVLYGIDQLAYAGRVLLPFAHQFPQKKAALVCTKKGQMALVLPYEWEQAVRDQGWHEKLLVYSENDGPQVKVLGSLLADFLKSQGLTKTNIGVDLDNQTIADQQVLAAQLPQVKWLSADAWISQLRKIKTPAEIKMLQQAAIQADRGVIGALNHLEGTVDDLGYTMKELAERLRVHVIEFGGTGIGDLSVAQGESAHLLYSPARGSVQSGKFLRMEINTHAMGYWCTCGRTVFVGQPNESQVQAYADQVLLHQAAVAVLKPGNSAGDVFKAVKKTADANGILFVEAAGVGYGVGMSEQEAPYLLHGNTEKLAAGMALMVNIFSFGPQGELICNNDMYHITAQGCEKLSTYKNWDKLYRVNGFRGTH
jgi:Xaa-Pro aminopeptidase